jgi:hypothetical protein
MLRISPRDLELPDVVEKGGAVEQIELALTEAELTADHLRVGADALRVAACQAVVYVERRDQPQQPLRGHGRCVTGVSTSDPGDSLFQRLDGARDDRDRGTEAGRRGAGNTDESFRSPARGTRRRESRPTSASVSVAATERLSHQPR